MEAATNEQTEEKEDVEFRAPAVADTSALDQELAGLPEEQKEAALTVSEYDIMMRDFDIRKAKENLEASRRIGTIGSADNPAVEEMSQDLEDRQARNDAEHAAVMAKGDPERKRVERDADGMPVWDSIKSGEVEKYRADHKDRLEKYKLELEQNVASVVVAPGPAAETFKRVVVIEQMEVIQKAAVADLQAGTPKEQVGAEVQKAMAATRGDDFKTALKYCSLPWWEATSTMISTGLLARLRDSGVIGKTVLKRIAAQNQKIHVNTNVRLTSHLAKLSMTRSSVPQVKASDFDSLSEKDLELVRKEYAAVVDGASLIERGTKNFDAAATLLRIVQQRLAAAKEGREIQTSQLAFVQTGQTSGAQKKRRVRAEGLPRKPRKKTPKPRKKRAPKKKKTPKKAPSPKKKPQTALQKWDAHRKTAGRSRRMHL